MPILNSGEDPAKMFEAISIINKKHKNEPQHEFPIPGQNKGATGVIECPACKGELSYSISGYNGHVWGKCKTDKCLSWMM